MTAPRDKIDFSHGMSFPVSPCEVPEIGHSATHPEISYDFKGVVSFICSRPFCDHTFKTVYVDDLDRDEYDQLAEVLKRIT